jgi:predicted nuclease of restriction endonuclease-like (RecB) superfamily
MNQSTTDISNFNSILTLIKTAKDNIIKTVNTEIIDLYWQIGKEVSEKVQNGGWGKSVVEELSNHIAANLGNIRGFSPQNIWRMKQFYETYKDSQILSALLRELSWTNNLLVMSRAKTDEERLFYIKLSIDEKYSRELERQFDAMRFERTAISENKLENLPVKK